MDLRLKGETKVIKLKYFLIMFLVSKGNGQPKYT
jgi:hypothetical protein